MGRSLAKKGGSAKKNGGHADWMDDEIDDANRLRSKDKIGFDASENGPCGKFDALLRPGGPEALARDGAGRRTIGKIKWVD